MKTLTIGTELEFTGLTRKAAAEVVAKYFGTTASYTGEGYAAWTIKGGDGREWKILRDTSIREDCTGEQCELVTPILNWADIELLQDIVWDLRAAGGKVNWSCGQHVHIGSAGMTGTAIRNLVNVIASREELFYKALKVDRDRKRRYCKPIEERFLKELNAKKPERLTEVKAIWYGDERDHSDHYDYSRYHAVNLHATFTKGTIEFRWFNGTLDMFEVAAAIHLSAALVAFAKRAKKTLYRPINTDNAKFAMRTFLTRPQGLNLNGEEFSATRDFLTKNLEGNGAWRFAC